MVRVGISGLRGRELIAPWISELALHLDVVEVSCDLYRLPSIDTLYHWFHQTPKAFKFALRASTYLSSLVHLKTQDPALRAFLKRVEFLDGKLGPLVFQFPKSWSFSEENLSRLSQWSDRLPVKSGFSYVFEFASRTWSNERTRSLLARRGITQSLDENGPEPYSNSGRLVHLRLDSPLRPFDSERWSRRLRSWDSEGKQVYVLIERCPGVDTIREAALLKDSLFKDSRLHASSY